MLEHLTEMEKQLVALCIEFEGSIFIADNSVVVQLMCTDQKLIAKFRDVVRCGNVTPKNDVGYTPSKTAWATKHLWTWKVKGTLNPERTHNGLGYKFYKEIEPYLLIKKLKLT